VERAKLGSKRLRETCGFWPVVRKSEWEWTCEETLQYTYDEDIRKAALNVALQTLRSAGDESSHTFQGPDLSRLGGVEGNMEEIAEKLWDARDQSWEHWLYSANSQLLLRQIRRSSAKRRHGDAEPRLTSKKPRLLQDEDANSAHALNLTVSNNCKPPSDGDLGCNCGLKLYDWLGSKDNLY
jgi:hypothetical protein